ncbi:hypothetical protein, partial [Halomonas sp. CSM-2]|uniref:hypothetical protein n=1 Tax=Halomonas sp. CSM-2 TaxID=1975722 RepID=UPI001C38A1CC
PISTVGFGNNGLAKANLHGANDQKVLAGGDRESVGAGFTDSGLKFSGLDQIDYQVSLSSARWILRTACCE